MSGANNKSPKGQVTVKAKNIRSNVSEDYRVDGSNIYHKAGQTFQQKSGKGKTVRNGDKEERKNKKTEFRPHSASLKLPLLIGYSRGYDYEHHFLSQNNSTVKNIALNLPDSISHTGMTIPINECDNMDDVPEEKLKENMWELLQIGTPLNNGMRQVAKEMYNHFIQNKGGQFANQTLNRQVWLDTNFQAFSKRVVYKILIKLKSIAWDLSKIDGNSVDLVRFDNVAFNTSGNRSDGLTITIDAVEHIEVYITAFSEKNKWCNLRLKFILYDTFGLDLEDIEKYGKRKSTSAFRHVFDWHNSATHVHIQNSAGYGFTSWWLLQHRFNHKPFVTKVSVECEGSFHMNATYQNPSKKEKTTTNDVNYK